MQFPAFAPGLSLWSAWARISCPVLIVRGARSAILPRDVVAKMLDAKPATEVVEIPDAGHAPSLMSAQEITLVSRFLERARARTNARPAISLSLRQPTSRS
jgi:pimeloyl-ACP methyl ester carboxylesterase